MPAIKGDQQKQLPVTTSSYIVDDKGTEGYYLFIVLLIGVVINIMLGWVPNNFVQDNTFPISAVMTYLVYVGFKRYLNGKPPKFLLHLLIYPFVPKKLTHQFRDAFSMFSDE